MPSRASAEPGVTVGGKYRLVRRIGVGGMGEVWVATNRTTGAEVAVKMGRGAAAREDSALRFRHEARLGRDALAPEHRPHLRSRRGGRRDARPGHGAPARRDARALPAVAGARSPRAEAIAIAIPILSALAHAHETGIVHRDVTPANVFLAVDPTGTSRRSSSTSGSRRSRPRRHAHHRRAARSARPRTWLPSESASRGRRRAQRSVQRRASSSTRC